MRKQIAREEPDVPSSKNGVLTFRNVNVALLKRLSRMVALPIDETMKAGIGVAT